MKKSRPPYFIYGAGLLVILLFITGVVAAMTGKPQLQDSRLKIISTENFWGSLASQLGGNKVQLTSVVSDPNADPHEYESNTTDARGFSSADLVIVNGAGYDSWAYKLLSSGASPNRKVLDVAKLIGKKNGDNPHFWYDPAYVNEAVSSMKKDLIALDPQDKGYFDKQYNSLISSLSGYQDRIKSISRQYHGTKVAATEDIFSYLASACELDLISPRPFTSAVAEGNDPTIGSLVTFQQQIRDRQPSVLVYNEQTITPLTQNIKKLAESSGIPAVGITETVQPANAKFQDWMNSELINLQKALQASKQGQ